MKRVLRPLTTAAVLAVVCLVGTPALASTEPHAGLTAPTLKSATHAAKSADATAKRVVKALGEYTGHGSSEDPQEALDMAVDDAAQQAEAAGEDLEMCEIVDYDVQPTEEGTWEAEVLVGCEGGGDDDGGGRGRARH